MLGSAKPKKALNFLSQGDDEVVKNRIFGLPTPKLTRHQRVAFTVMIKIAYDALTENKNRQKFACDVDTFLDMMDISAYVKRKHLLSR